MDKKVHFILEILKNKKTPLVAKDFCRCGLCPVILNQWLAVYENDGSARPDNQLTFNRTKK
jgi:hypothetical protein